MKPYCAACGHLRSRHEGSIEDEFATSHGGVGYAFCDEVLRSGESADVCGCRLVVGDSSGQARGRLWPTERPAIATIPAPGSPLTSVRLISTEVTTTDPITGQPDFEHVEILYTPVDRLIDTKSLKAYWRWWRGSGASMERLSTLVALDIARATRALTVDVLVREAPRGGISIEASASVTSETLRRHHGVDRIPRARPEPDLRRAALGATNGTSHSEAGVAGRAEDARSPA